MFLHHPLCQIRGQTAACKAIHLTSIHAFSAGRSFFMTAWSTWLRGVLVALSFIIAGGSAASAESRTLKLFYIHTQEKGEFTFKRNGRYDQGELKKLNRFLRDWRRNEPTKMDPRLFDLVWEAYRQVGASGYIHVVSAYRSPATNSMLRKRSKGVAERSQHMLGHAMDFYIPGVKLQKLRYAAMRLQGGGVGYYPRSGAPFVHMDVGTVRHWPRMNRKELASVFPNGKTLHVPTDGKPLPGYEQAMAAYNSRKSSGSLSAVTVASSSGGSTKKGGGLLAAFFGGGADEEEDNGNAEAAVAAVAPKPAVKAPAPVVEAPAAVAAAPADQRPAISIVPPELARPATPVAEEPEAIIAALPARQVPVPLMAPRPAVDVGPAEAEVQPDAVAALAAAEAATPELPAQTPLAPGEVELALKAPLPSWRPDLTPPAELLTDASPQAKDPALLALLERDEGASLPLPEARPDVSADEDETDPAVSALTVASLPETGPVVATQPAISSIGGIPGKPVDAAALLPQASTPVPANAPTRTASIAPGQGAGAAVKTTAKSAKPGRRDKRPQPRPVVVSAQPDDARWAFDNTYVAQRTAGTKAPSLAYNIVRTAPREVYTAGFAAGDQAAATNKFTGKAVTFLSVARFETN